MGELKVNIKQGILGPAIELILNNKHTSVEGTIERLDVIPNIVMGIIDKTQYLSAHSAAIRLFGGFEFNGEWFNTGQQVEGEPWCYNCGGITRSPKMRYYNKKPHCVHCLMVIEKRNRGDNIQLLGDDYK